MKKTITIKIDEKNSIKLPTKEFTSKFEGSDEVYLFEFCETEVAKSYNKATKKTTKTSEIRGYFMATVKKTEKNTKTVCGGPGKKKKKRKSPIMTILTQILERLTNLETKVDRIEVRVENLENDMQIVKTKVNNLETKVDNLENDMQIVKTKVNNLETKVDNLETNVGNLNSDMKMVKEHLSL